MKRLFILLLILCMCCTSACKINKNNIETEKPSPTTTPIEIPDENDAIQTYLKNKYAKDFTCIGYNEDKSIFYYSTPDFPGPVNVYTLNALWLGNYNMDHFTENYADNGYIYTSHNDVYKSIWDCIDILSQYSIIIDMNAKVLPSIVDAKIPYTTNALNFPEYFNLFVYVLYDCEIKNDTLGKIKEKIEKNHINATVFFIDMPQEKWNDMTLEEIKTNKVEYIPTYSFTTFEK